MPFALLQLTGHSGAQHGESVGPLAEEETEEEMDGWMEGRAGADK